jgi:hypothetical protein
VKNISPSKFLEDFGNQKRTPKSEQNILIDKQRPQQYKGFYIYACKNHATGAFYTQKDMSSLRFEEEVSNSKRKRGEADYNINPYHK